MKIWTAAILDGPHPATISKGWSFESGDLYIKNREGLKLFSGKVKSRIHTGFGTFTEGIFHKKTHSLVNVHTHEHEDDPESVLVAFAIQGGSIELSDFLAKRRARHFEHTEHGTVGILIFSMKKDEQVSIRFRQGPVRRELIVSYDEGFSEQDLQVFEAGASEKPQKQPGRIQRFLGLIFRRAA